MCVQWSLLKFIVSAILPLLEKKRYIQQAFMSTDCFQAKVSIEKSYARRGLLSMVSQVYDVLVRACSALHPASA